MDSSQATSVTAPAAAQPFVDALPQFDDEDLALGCESADPSLQIDSWRQEAFKLMHGRS